MFKRAINKDGRIVRIDNYPTREAAYADKPFSDTNQLLIEGSIELPLAIIVADISNLKLL